MIAKLLDVIDDIKVLESDYQRACNVAAQRKQALHFANQTITRLTRERDDFHQWLLKTLAQKEL